MIENIPSVARPTTLHQKSCAVSSTVSTRARNLQMCPCRSPLSCVHKQSPSTVQLFVTCKTQACASLNISKGSLTAQRPLVWRHRCNSTSHDVIVAFWARARHPGIVMLCVVHVQLSPDSWSSLNIFRKRLQYCYCVPESTTAYFLFQLENFKIVLTFFSRDNIKAISGCKVVLTKPTDGMRVRCNFVYFFRTESW